MSLPGDDAILGTDRKRRRSAAMILGFAFRAAPVHTTLLAVLTALFALCAAGTAYSMKLITDAVFERDVDAAALGVVALVGIAMLSSLSSLFTFVLRQRVTESTQLLIELRLIELSTTIEGLEHHERPEYVDQMQRIRDHRSQLSGAVAAIGQLAMVVIQLLGTLGALLTVHPWLAVLPLFGLPCFFLESRGERMRRASWERSTTPYRLGQHLFNLATTSAPGKELRIFGLAGTVHDRHAAVLHATRHDVNRVGRRAMALSMLGWALFSIGYLAALAVVTARVLDGSATPGDVVLVLTLGSQVNEQVSTLVGVLLWAMQSLDVVRRVLWLEDFGAAAQRPIAEPAAVPDRLVDGIRLEGVRFRYPGTDVDVLRDVDLHIPAGSIVAIVGDNGAGKSTLVKLLCRFYVPDEGHITVDGIDLRQLPAAAWRAATAAGFQDFARYELLARETVGVGDLTRLDDEPHIREALDRGSAADVVDQLAAGLDTQLGRTFSDGVELSGGQWQKLALGRAMMRPAPLLLLLDEPTAAIDAETEHALFQRFAGAAKEAAQQSGAITVLVSHRFSTVRMADLIVVVDGGGVVECGSHHVLMGRGGLYAELYDLQASSYR